MAYRASAAGTHETLEPRDTGRTGGYSGRDELVAAVLEGLQVLLPESSGIARIKVSLATVVGSEEGDTLSAKVLGRV